MMSPQRSPTIEALFEPEDVRAFQSDADERFFARLHDRELAGTDRMAESRRAEYATGRACARAALSELGVVAAVPRQTSGAPRWPESTTGSISHTKGYVIAVAASAPTAAAPAIGIDVEEAARMKPGIERRILGAAEVDALAGVEGLDRLRVVTTIFAAKEAFYKAHFTLDARYLGFDAVSVVIDGAQIEFGPDSGTVDERLLQRTHGRWLLEHGRIVVGVRITPADGGAPLPSPA